MSDAKAMEQRLRDYLKRSEIETTETSIGWALAFAFDEVRAALAPRGQNPELAEAEAWLREVAQDFDDYDQATEQKHRLSVADELDRLRVVLSRIASGPCLSDESDGATECCKVVEPKDYCDRCTAFHAIALLSQPAPAQYTDTETEARCRLKNALIATVNSPDHADFTRYQEALENLIEVVRGSAPAQDRATLKALLDFCACLNVCHVCGDVLCDPGADDSIAAYTRCEAHANAVDDEEDGEEWHISRDTWNDRYTAAARIITAERAGKDGT